MTDNDTLLGFIAQRHTIGLEDVATDALCFILSGSQAARGALSDFPGRRQWTLARGESGAMGGRCAWVRAGLSLP